MRHTTPLGAHIHRKRMKNSLLDVYQCRKCKGWHVGRSRDPGRCAQRIGEVLDRYDAALAKRLVERNA